MSHLPGHELHRQRHHGQKRHAHPQARARRIRRPVLRAYWSGAISRKHFQAAGELRHRDARHPGQNPGLRRIASSRGAGRNCRPAKRDRPCNWPHRIGKIIHARCHPGQDECRKALSHPHYRGPHRIPASPQKSHDSPARIAFGHAEFCAGIARGVAAGAQSDPRRRDARPRNHRNCTGGLRDRPPGDVHAAHH